jgi:hypothetical protein
MNCGRIRDILGDYIDGELSAEEADGIRQHLKECGGCRDYERALREGVIAPLKGAGRFEAPASVWSGIEGAIAAGRTAPGAGLGVPRPVLAGALVLALMAVAAGILLYRGYLQKEDPVETYIEEQVDFLNGLGSNGEMPYVEPADINFGTAIEAYFM